MIPFDSKPAMPPWPVPNINPISQGENIKAVAFLDKTEEPADIPVLWDKIGLLAGSARVRDWVAQADLGEYIVNFTAANFPARGVVLVKIVSASE